MSKFPRTTSRIHELCDKIIFQEKTIKKLEKECDTLRELEKQYCERIGELARLSDVVCSWVLENKDIVGLEIVLTAADDIMEYVDEIRPMEMEHVTTGEKCWCDPEVVDGVVVHRRTDN